MTTTPTLWGANTQVNPSSSDDQVQHEIIGLSNGNHLVVFADDSGTVGFGTGRDIVGVIYGPTGEIVQAAFQVNTGRTSHEEENPSIAATNDGGFVVAYEDRDANGQSLILERFDATGARIVSTIVQSDPGAQFVFGPKVTVDQSDNSIFVSYSWSDGTDDSIRGKAFDSDLNVAAGTPPDGHILRNDDEIFSSLGPSSPESATLSNGDHVTVFEEDDASQGIEFRISDGTTGANGFSVNVGGAGTTTGAIDFDPQVAALSGGGFVVVWVEDDGTNDNIRYAIFGNTGGQVLGPTVMVATGNNYTMPDVVGLEDGGFFVAVRDTTSNTIEGTRFDAAGNRIGSGEFGMVSADTPREPELGLTTDGRILLAWTDSSGDIFKEIWDPRDTTITADGTEGAITARTTDDTTIFGSPGDETILGGTGNDSIEGDGTDQAPFGLMRFNEGSVVDQYAEATSFGAMPTDAFTVEWLFRSFGAQVNDASFVSYATSDSNNEFLVFGAEGGEISVFVNGAQTFTGVDTDTVFDGDLHRMSVSVDTTDGPVGRISLYVDGVELFSGLGSQSVVGDPIEAGGTFIIGQDQDVLGGGFQTTQALRGGVGDIRVWSTERTQTDIAATALTQFDAADLPGNPSLVANWQVDIASGAVSALTGAQALELRSPGANTFTAENSVGGDSISGGAGDDTIVGGAGDDTIEGGAGADDMDGGGGINTLSYATSDGRVAVDLSGRFFINLGPSHAVGDTFSNFHNVIGSDFDDQLFGDAGNNLIEGGDGNDVITDLEGAQDTIRGGDGDDFIGIIASVNTVGAIYNGGAEEFGDRFRVSLRSSEADFSDDVVVGFERFEAENFIDNDDRRVLFTQQQITQFDSFQFASLSGRATLAVAMQSTSLDLSGKTIDDPAGLLEFEIIGTSGGDSIIGSATGDSIEGGNGSDTIDGGDGDDTISSVNGDASILGGEGDDYILGGFSSDDTLRGGAGNDTIEAIGGGVVEGNANNDTFIVLNSFFIGDTDLSDGDVFDGGDGTDVFDASFSTSAAYRIDLDNETVDRGTVGLRTVALVNVENAIGSQLGDTIIGDGLANVLRGEDGNDTISGGGGGNDTIEGGDGADSLTGGTGIDSILGGEGDDYIRGGATFDDTLRGGDGNDTLEAVGGGVIEGNADNDTFIVLAGKVIGDSDTADDDRFDGGTGTDIFDASEEVSNSYRIDLSAQTVDRGTVGSRTVALVNFENATGGQLGDTITGNALANVLRGEAGDDTIHGGAGADRVFGDAGADRMFGDAGADRMFGGGGADSLNGGNDTDILIGETRGIYHTDVSAQVFRMFAATLGREPGVDGHQAWAQQLAIGAITLDGMASGFVGSPEFQNTYGSLDNAQFVTLLFNNVLGREPNTAGLTGWVNNIESGMSRAEVVRRFSESTEHVIRTAPDQQAFDATHDPTEWVDDVYRLFRAVFDREPGEAGFTGWVDNLSSGRLTFDEVVVQFMASAEFQTTYGNTSNMEFVELLFDNVLGRPGAPAGVTGWTNNLDAGMSREEVVQLFMSSPEFVIRTEADLRSYVAGFGPDDVLDPGAGDAVVSGGLFADTFVFTDDAVASTVTVTDLEVFDTLRFTGFGLNAAQIRGQMTQDGDAVVFVDGTETIIFANTALADITEAMITIA